MIRRIARKEMTEMLRDGRFRWAAAIVLLLLLASLLMGAKNYRDIKRQHDLAQAETREQWIHQPAKNPHSAAHYGIYAFKPKMLAAMLDLGVDPYVGQSVWLEAHKQNEFRYRPAQDSTAVQRFGELTAATVLQLLIPLLIILLAFSAFVGEREQGTLRQLLSIGVRQSDLVWGKALVDRFRFLSPAIVTQSALNDIAGTGIARYRHFLGLVDQFHQVWRDYFTPRIVQRVQLGAADYDQFPSFLFREESLGQIARRVLAGLPGLLFPALLIGWHGLRRLRRYSLAG